MYLFLSEEHLTSSLTDLFSYVQVIKKEKGKRKEKQSNEKERKKSNQMKEKERRKAINPNNVYF